MVLGAEVVTLESGKTQVQSFSETSRLFDYGFDNFAYQTILTRDEFLKEVSVALSKTDFVTVQPASDVEVLLPRDLTPSDLTRRVTIPQEPVDAPIRAGQVLGTVELSHGDTVYATVLLPRDLTPSDLTRRVTIPQEPVDAPIRAGQVLGTVELSHGDTVYATVDLLASTSVEASRLRTFWRNVQLFFARPAVRIIAIVLGVLLAAALLWKLLFGRRRYRYGRSVTRSSRRGYRGRRRR